MITTATLEESLAPRGLSPNMFGTVRAANYPNFRFRRRGYLSQCFSLCFSLRFSLSLSFSFSSVLEPALANEGTAARLSTAGATNTAFWSTSRRVVSSALCSAAIKLVPLVSGNLPHSRVCLRPRHLAGLCRRLRAASSGAQFPSAAFLDTAEC